jgi:hypothetical protein
MRLVYLVISMLLVGGALSLSFATAAPTASVQPATFIAAATTAATNSVWWVGASSSDSSTLPNTGARINIPVIVFTVSGCLSFWVAEGFANGYWGQVGYYICDGSTPVSFYQIWNLGSYTILAGGSGAAAPTGTPTFSMYLQSGTTWAYAVGGTVMGTYNMGESTTSSTYPVEAYSEEQSTGVYVFPAITLSAIQVQNTGSWGGMTTSVSYGTAYGVQGNLQNSNLPKNEIIVGGSLPALPSSTKLWAPVSTTTSSTTSSSKTSSTTSSSTTSSSTTSSSTSSSSSTTSTPPTLTVTSTQTVTSTVTSTPPASTTTVTSTPPASTTTVTSTPPASTTTTTVTTTTPMNTTVQTVIATETFCVQGNPAQGVTCSTSSSGPLSQRGGGTSLTSIGVGGLLLAGAGAGAILLNRRRSRNRTRTRAQSV